MALSVAVTERREFVIKMRTAGASLDQCAQEAKRKFGEENLPRGYEANDVWKDIQRAQYRIYRDLGGLLTTFRLIQTERYENLIRAHWLRAMAGHLGATDRVLKAMRDQSRLLGLEAPQQVDMRVVQVDARIEQLMEAVGARRQIEAPGGTGGGTTKDHGTIVEGTARHL